MIDSVTDCVNTSLPPHSITDEAGVLSCIMQKPELIHDVFHHLQTESFYDLKHQILYSALREKHESSEPIDMITLQTSLRESGNLENLGGVLWLSNVQDAAPSPQNFESYLRVVIDKSIRRRMIKRIGKLNQLAEAGHPLEEIANYGRSLFEFESPNSIPVLDGSQSGQLLVDDLERRHNLNGELSGLDTGFDRFNSLTEGLQFGEQTLIGARPSMGKTAIGLNIFEHAVFRRGIPSLLVSLEMSTASVMRRILSSHCSIPMNDIRRGSYTHENFQSFMGFNRIVNRMPLYIIDATFGLSIGELCYRVRSSVLKHGIKLVVIDYLQKIQPAAKQEKRTYEIGDISGKLKSLAVETKAAFLTLAQLNRESEKDKGRVPRISDLADSGQIERDADTIALIHRDRTDPSGETQLVIGKQRDGETGVVNLTFNGKYCRFENAP